MRERGEGRGSDRDTATAAVAHGIRDGDGTRYPLVGRSRGRATVTFGSGDCQAVIGADDFCVIAGPCAVESEAQVVEIACAVKRLGAQALRAGAFKPRTSPYDFRGLGVDGLKALAAARSAAGLPIVTEVVSERDVELVSRYADMLQVGSRNMHNHALLKEAGRSGMPILLKRGFAALVDEWLLAAEYIAREGNERIVLCERGVRGFETYTRNTLDLSAVLAVRELSHLAVIVDPSHGSGRASMVKPLSMGALAVGADGVMIEVHSRPHEAKSDGPQALTIPAFGDLIHGLAELSAACGKRMSVEVGVS